jgi:gas vesicle protein
MFQLLAQTTLPAVPDNWITFIIQIGTLIGTITALIVAVKSSQKSDDANKKSEAAKDTAADAKGDAKAAQAVGDVNSQRITNVSNHAANIDGKVTDLALKIPSNGSQQ